MRRLLITALPLLVNALLCLATPPISWAQLGKSPQAATRQLANLNLEESESHSAGPYRYVEFTSPGIVVKQYVNSATNIVFALTWTGKHMPSLSALLGFDPRTVSGAKITRSLHAARIQAGKLDISMIGLVGHYSGSAIRTDLLPPGVPISAVTP